MAPANLIVSLGPLIPPPHILVVDDDELVLTTVTETLRQTGYQVACAEDGEDGWSALCSDHFDLLITDHEMPRLTGLSLLRRVRTTQTALPVIMISGNPPQKESDFARLLTPGLVLDKPFSFVELLACIRRFLSPAQPLASASARSRSDLPWGQPPFPAGGGR